MKKIGKSKDKYSVGLDIGTQSIKIAKLKILQEQVELSDFNLVPVQLEMGEILKKIKQAMDIETVNIGISGPQTVVRQINFPKMNQDELKQALKFEAQKYIPFPITEINLDGYILKADLPENKMLVLIAAAKKELINQRIKLIEDVGLKLDIICIDSISLINAFNFNYAKEDFFKQKAIALLNIGATITNLDILENGTPRLSRDINIAGNDFTQKIMEIFGLDFKSAEELKLNPDELKSQKLLTAQESIFTNLASEIRTSFDYYESQSTTSVVKIFLSGGGSNFIGLKDTLANSLGIEVEYWNPLKQVSLSSEMDPAKLKTFSNHLAVAVGLALRY
jgi:type IV pilus assembly protein PilM